MKLGAARTLKSDARWFRVLLDLPFVGVAIFDLQSRKWTQFNDRLCELLGYKRDELGRLSWRELCHPRDHAGSDALFRRVISLRTGHVRSVHRLVRKDRSLLQADIDLSVMRPRAGMRGQLVALVSQVAAAREDAAATNFQKVFREGNTAVVVLDSASWDVADLNPAAQRFYGWSLEEIRRRGLKMWDVSKAGREAVLARLREAARGALTRVEDVHTLASGETRRVEIYCGPISVSGRRCVYGIVHDLTERERAEAARRDAEEKLQAVVEQSITGIYIVEEGRFSYVNPRLAEIFGYAPAELTGTPVLDLVAPEDRDLVLRNIARRMSGELNSVQYDFRGLRKDGARIDVGAHGNVATIRGKRVIVGVLQDITERRKSRKRIDEYVRRLEAAMLATVDSITRMVDLRDPYTAGHERRVAHISAAIARELGLENEKVRGLEIAGRLHDIGKISVPAEILSKPARLSSAEFEIVKLHSVHGHGILNVVDFPWAVAEIAHQHHERMDGSGYPRGLKNGAIIHEARILAVADVIEAMASHRPYRASLGIESALLEVERGAGSLYDADVCGAARRLFRDRRYQIPA